MASIRPYSPPPAFLEINLPSFEDVGAARHAIARSSHGAYVVTRPIARSSGEEGWAVQVYQAATASNAPRLGFTAHDPHEALEIVGRYMEGGMDDQVREASA